MANIMSVVNGCGGGSDGGGDGPNGSDDGKRRYRNDIYKPEADFKDINDEIIDLARDGGFYTSKIEARTVMQGKGTAEIHGEMKEVLKHDCPSYFTGKI
ncbi:Hypothetical predicted protein [Octopus vulgaris]|uniref:Uncharacterized protein n=1 Tax=Octopus vulgaris TaxID=6645 RepID=A0AA36BMS5_OCTVU|nr:Hypothetical predicted protein [Octopus vulgaris]